MVRTIQDNLSRTFHEPKFIYYAALPNYNGLSSPSHSLYCLNAELHPPYATSYQLYHPYPCHLLVLATRVLTLERLNFLSVITKTRLLPFMAKLIGTILTIVHVGL